MEKGCLKYRATYITKCMYLIDINDCPDNKLTDVSSKSHMEKNGWSFDTNFNGPDANVAACAKTNTWYGFKFLEVGEKVGTVKAKFTGSGTATLDYGNCFTAGKVNVYLNAELKDVAVSNTPSKKITFDFSPNDVLLLSETDEDAIIKLNTLTLTCNKGKAFFHA